jgi:hypothetical protein
MSFLRPEVTAALHRWREVLAGLGVVAAGGWLAGVGGPFWQGLGALVALAGLGLALGGLRRMRFRPAGLAPGVVQIVEGQLAYFGPDTGGFAALTEVEELRLEPRPGGLVWVLDQPGGPLVVPVGAAGAEALADWVTALPGIDMAALHAALGRPVAGPRVLWRREERVRLPG